MKEQPSAGGAGLSAAEAARRLQQFGPNEAAEERRHPVRVLFGKFWAPVPWMLEGVIVLQLLLGRDIEAAIIAALLIFNAVLGFLQENRASNALALLRHRLTVQARVLREGRWQLLPARELVPGDVIHLRMGDLTPADVRLDSGSLLLDQSALTGESAPVEIETGGMAPAGTMVQRGEAGGEVTATGTHTAYGKTAELVRRARSGSHLQTIVFTVVKYLIALDAVLVAIVLIYALIAAIPLHEILPFALILLVASVPVALPATFTVATALGALELARQGVLATRLSAIEEAAGMDVLCSDKTGTLTENRLSVASVVAYPPTRQEEVLHFAAAACEDSTQDALDLAILHAARVALVAPAAEQRLRFIPFDPALKRSEAVLRQGEKVLHVVKGAPQIVGGLCGNRPPNMEQDVERLAAEGCRILAIAAGSENALHLVGLIAFQDPPRLDSRSLVRELHNLGIRVLMVTGDTPSTARMIAHQVEIGEGVCLPEQFQEELNKPTADCEVFAGVLPEDKYRLVCALQKEGHTVGMTGDGVNDAPALKQAEVGIAVANATDVAKAAAGLVLTNPGLRDLVAAVRTSRRIYQRMLTYTLNKIVKTIEIALLLSLGLLFTGTFVTTPVLIVLLLFTNDFVTMALATDRVAFSPTPDRWRIRALVWTALPLAVFILALSFGLFLWGREVLHLAPLQLQTLIFILLVFSGQGTVYLVRERRHCWASRPSGWLLTSSLLDILFVIALAAGGIFMEPLPLRLILEVLGLVVLYLLALDFLKVRIVRVFQI
jgi:H+-transporting ATPase